MYSLLPYLWTSGRSPVLLTLGSFTSMVEARVSGCYRTTSLIKCLKSRLTVWDGLESDFYVYSDTMWKCLVIVCADNRQSCRKYNWNAFYAVFFSKLKVHYVVSGKFNLFSIPKLNTQPFCSNDWINWMTNWTLRTTQYHTVYFVYIWRTLPPSFQLAFSPLRTACLFKFYSLCFWVCIIDIVNIKILRLTFFSKTTKSPFNIFQ